MYPAAPVTSSRFVIAAHLALVISRLVHSPSGPVAQGREHSSDKAEVGSSNLPGPTLARPVRGLAAPAAEREVAREAAVGFGEGCGDQPHLGQSAQVVGVAPPARQDMGMEMSGDAGSRHLTLVDPDVEALRPEFLAEH